MPNKKNLTLLIIIALILTVSLCSFQKTTILTSNSNRELAIKVDSPVNIDGNYGLEQSACSGHGNSTHPYILENLVIDAIGFGCGISIRNTNAHFILKNCTVMNANHTGIQLENVTNASLMNNSISNIRGVNGIAGGVAEPGTDGIEAFGMFLTNCLQVVISSNIIVNISGGIGGNGGAGNSSLGDSGWGGDGGSAYGIYLNSSNECSITHSNVSNVIGGKGGNGGGIHYQVTGDGGAGGMGGMSLGVNCKTSTNITNSWNLIQNVISGAGGAGGSGGMAYPGPGGAGGDGGDGGLSAGIYCNTSINLTNNWNVIEIVTSGAGGNGGVGGWSSGVGGDGADGGLSFGLYFKTSTRITNIRNRIKNVTGGSGGVGGQGAAIGITLARAADGISGTGNIEYGIGLEHSNESIILFNLIYCQFSLDNGLNNRWHDGFIGNYWAFHAREDSLPYNGIGDIYKNINGTANSRDKRPILLLPLEADFEGDGLSNLEEYTLGADGYRTNATGGRPAPPVLQHILPNPSASGTIELNWNDVPGAIQYYIYKNTSPILSLGTLNPIAKVNESKYTDATTEGTYYYVVIAENLENSTLSNCVSVVSTAASNIPGFEFILFPIALIAIIAIHTQRKDKIRRL